MMIASAEPEIDRLAPRRRPPGRSIGLQRWRHLLFLHWQMPAEALRPHIPSELTLDTFAGRAYLGIIPFTMPEVRPWWVPPIPIPIPGLFRFHELNLRTYVHRDGRDPGVWFFSLDAASLPAVLAARAGWRLPYHYALMRLARSDTTVDYRSSRRWPGPAPARFRTRYRIDRPLSPAQPGTLEYFLVERYLLYTRGGSSGVRIGPVHHRPYPLSAAHVEPIEETITRAAGLPAPNGPPHVLYSSGVDVEVFALRT